MYNIGEEEIKAIAGVIRSGKLFRYGEGDQCLTFEKRYADYLGSKHFRLTCSGSYALHAAIVGLGIGPGDEVIVPAHTYMATATSVLTAGAIPVVTDVDESITMDPDALEDAVGPQTKAVIPVHIWGASCNMDAIMSVAKKHNLLVIEDTCQGIGGGYEGRMLGTIGHAGAYSFNYFKNIGAGEGGGVVINDDALDKRIACVIDPCHYYWTGRTEDFMPFASNGARASEIMGAVLNSQLDRLPEMIAAMRAEKNQILANTRHLDNLGLKPTPMNSPNYECGTHVMYTMPTAEVAAKFSEVMPSVIAGKTGRHTYTEWDQILIGEGAAHPLMNPYKMDANQKCRRTVTKDMLPRSLDILGRTVMIPTDPCHSEEQIGKMIRNIEVAARYAFGEMTSSEIESRMAEFKDADKIDSRKYDTDVAAYGLGQQDETPATL